MSDLQRVFQANERVARFRAEHEAATAKLELSKTEEAIATLLSRAEPVAGLGVNREHLRLLLAFLSHHDLKRLMREVKALPVMAAPTPYIPPVSSAGWQTQGMYAAPPPPPTFMGYTPDEIIKLKHDHDALKLENEHLRATLDQIGQTAFAVKGVPVLDSIGKMVRAGFALSAPTPSEHTYTATQYNKLEMKHESLLTALFSIVDKTEKLSCIEGSLISRLRMIAVQAVDNDKL